MGQKIKKLKKIRLHREGTESAGYRSDSVSSHCGYIVDNLRQQDSVLGFCCCVRYGIWYRAQLLPLPYQIPQRRGYFETGSSTSRRKDCGDRRGGECSLLR